VRKAKQPTCRKWSCEEPPFLGGLCKAHHGENHTKEVARRAAIEALTSLTINGKLPEKPQLKDELLKAARWWDRACMALRLECQDSALKDEIASAPEWCIAIANAIIQEEASFRAGREADATTLYLKRLSWERFENLEAGLMSNGVQRPEK
jgi:hypothetical protein